MEKSDWYIIKNKKNVIQVWNDMWVSKWWQNFHFINSSNHHVSCSSVTKKQNKQKTVIDYLDKCFYEKQYLFLLASVGINF